MTVQFHSLRDIREFVGLATLQSYPIHEMCIRDRERDTRMEPSISSGAAPIASSTWLRWPLLHAEPAETYTSRSCKALISPCERRPRTARFTMCGASCAPSSVTPSISVTSSRHSAVKRFCSAMSCWRVGKMCIRDSLRSDPLSQNEPPVEHARIQPRVALADGRRERGIVLHGKVQIQTVARLRAEDPLVVKPVLRPLRIAVEPQAAAGDGACLLYTSRCV